MTDIHIYVYCNAVTAPTPLSSVPTDLAQVPTQCFAFCCLFSRIFLLVLNSSSVMSDWKSSQVSWSISKVSAYSMSVHVFLVIAVLSGVSVCMGGCAVLAATCNTHDLFCYFTAKLKSIDMREEDGLYCVSQIAFILYRPVCVYLYKYAYMKTSYLYYIILNIIH